MKKSNIITIIVFLLMIGGLSVTGFVMKDTEFSQNENRTMAQKPKFTVANVMDGSFQDDLEDYLKDQIAGRDLWISVKSGIQKIIGNKDIGGAYVGKDGYDFEQILPENVDDKLVKNNIQYVSEYLTNAQSIVGEDQVSVLMIPTSGLVEEKYLPDNAILFDQDAYLEEFSEGLSSVNYVCAKDVLEQHSDEYIYYRTDHHWTSLGALYGYSVWMQETKGETVDVSTYHESVVTEDFRGSLYSKVLDYDSAYDSIWSYTDDSVFTSTGDGDDLGFGFYDAAKLSVKDKYSYFFGGNYGELKISGGSGEGNLLVIKDSFANEFLPLVADNYENVYVIDLRYYNQDLTEYLTANDIDEVLVLYNVSNFISDRNLYKLTD